ncbi:MAG: phage baseplate assembly protein V [Candidatus Electrothrix communis]|nr:MAG: phage baseplate assembly protein V [Candidatus Electrothrix communis]
MNSNPDGGRQQYYGVYPAIVTDIVDPDNLGRVEVKFPWLGTDSEKDVRAWATLLSPYADKDQGFLTLPEIDSQVVVAFEAGNLHRPYIVGACWNGQEALPVKPEKANNKRVIKTRSGSILEFDDSKGAARITLSTERGHKLEMDEGARTVTLTHSDGAIVRFTASGQIEIQANATVEVSAAAMNVHVPVATFDGMINCTTLNASVGVSSPMYTPGAGNVW